MDINEVVEPIANQAPQLLINYLIIIGLFLLGIAFGYFLLRTIYAAATKKKYKAKKTAREVEKAEIYDDIIIPSVTAYDAEYGNASTSEKLEGFKKAFLNMLTNISKAYYPDSDYPIFEVSADAIIKLADNIADRINRQLKRFLDDNFLVKNAFKAGVYVHNKSKKDTISYDWREIKISTIKSLIENLTAKPVVEEQEKKSFFGKVGASVKALPNKIFASFLNSKLRELIVETGMEIDKIYGGSKHAEIADVQTEEGK